MMLFSYLKFILFTFGLPFIAFNAVLKKVYGYTLFQVAYGWVANFRALDPLVGLVIMSFIFTPFLLLPVGSFFNALYLQAFGENQEMIYVGGDDFGGMYIDLSSQNLQAMPGPGVGASDSAAKIYKKYLMVRDPLTKKGWAGQLKKSMGIGGMTARFLFAVGGFLVVLTILVFYSEYLYAFYHASYSMPKSNSDEFLFFDYLAKFGISYKLYWIVLLLIFPAAIATYIATVKYTSDRYLDLPKALQPGGEFIVKPLSIDRVRKKERGIDRDEWRWVDTPFYDMYFISHEKLPHAIYGSARFDSREDVNRVEEIKTALEDKEHLGYRIRVDENSIFRFYKP